MTKVSKILALTIQLNLIIAIVTGTCFAETIRLKTGKEIEGKIVERTDKYIKLNFNDVILTFFINEI
jgi:hypothetical protein